MATVWRQLRFLALAMVVAAVGACSTLRLSYNYADDWVLFTLDGMLDLRDEQREMARSAVRDFHVWHRTTQLDLYSETVRTVAPKLDTGLSAADILAITASVRAHMATLADQAAEPVARLALTLEPEQVTSLERDLAKGRAESERRYQRSTPDERLGRRVEGTVEGYRRWIGRPTEQQLERIRAFWLARPQHYAMAQAERAARHQAIVDTARDLSTRHPPLAAAAPQVREAVEALEHSGDPERRAYFDQLSLDLAALASELFALATPEQRQQAKRAVQGLHDDFTVLASRGRREQARQASSG
ncbi:MAG: hypothetical protein EXQ85_06860 [Alphaproteobacteria bacterium]|nr:hypothetical protein [Alphaproteobacteria bacterium]